VAESSSSESSSLRTSCCASSSRHGSRREGEAVHGEDEWHGLCDGVFVTIAAPVDLASFWVLGEFLHVPRRGRECGDGWVAINLMCGLIVLEQ
jgi:hypothetical protein